MKVSFIIPVYKVEKYLDQCVESILAQTYKNFEILLVDDGSPDSCPVLCDRLADSDSRIKAFHKPNGGLSDARNYGIMNAKGDYVVFVDGDDFWKHENDLEKLVNIAQKYSDADFIGYNCDYFYPDSNNYTSWTPYTDVLNNLSNKNTATTALVKSGTFPMSACLKFIKRDFLINNELYFVKGQLAEDIPWFINVLDKCEKCMFVNEYIYAYRQNVVGSITNSANSTAREKSYNNLLGIFKSELEKIDSRSFNQEAKDAIKSFLAYEYCILLTFDNLTKEKFNELYQYKDILHYTLNPKVKMAALIYRMFGLRATRFVLCLYQMRRRAKK